MSDNFQRLDEEQPQRLFDGAQHGHQQYQQPDIQPPQYSIDPNAYNIPVGNTPNYTLGYDASAQPQQGYQQETYNTYQMGATIPGSATIMSAAQGVADKIPESVKQNFHSMRDNVKETILSRDYQVSITKWIGQAWQIYKTCWWGFSGMELLLIIVGLIPVAKYTLIILVYPFIGGWFIAAANSLRNGTDVRFGHMWHGLLFTIPLVIQAIIVWLATSIGFLLCFVPGLFLIVTLSFSPFIYLEYYSNGISILDAMSLSVKVTFKRFFLVAWFTLAMWLFGIAGILALGIGVLVTVPMVSICYAVAFQEIFGLNMGKQIDNECIVGM